MENYLVQAPIPNCSASRSRIENYLLEPGYPSMDLVSSTLDRYLKHRFNGDIKLKRDNDEHSTSVSQFRGDVVDHSVMENSDIKTDPIEINIISFQKLMPCCVALRDNCSFIAAGFENSHIYLWQLKESDNEKQQKLEKSLPQAPSRGELSRIIRQATKHRLLAHSGPVYSIKFIKDDDLMLSCSEDTTIRLWCLNTKCNLNIFRGHNYPIWSIAIAPQGDYFASASMDTTARLWRLDKMCPLRIFCGHDEDVECVEFHPNAKYVATGSADCTVRLWSIADGRMVRLMVGHKKSIHSLSFLPNGKLLASASSDGSIKVWNLATNSVTNDLSVPEQQLSQASISFSPEQSFVSTCGCDRILSIWQIGLNSFTKIKEMDLEQSFSKVVQTHFSRNNKLFVVGYKEPYGTAQTSTATTTTTTKSE